MLLKTEKVLKYLGFSKQWAHFNDHSPENSELKNVTFVDLKVSDWEEMGTPTTVTITIEAGDKLN